NAVFAFPSQIFGATQLGKEQWFFINGIGTDKDLALKNAERLRDLFAKEFITIYNPTQGLLLDLAESALQKFRNVNTEPVARAFIEIATALADNNVNKVVVIAHSQGTIITGDVLDLIYYAIEPQNYYKYTNMNKQDIDDFLKASHRTIKSDELHDAIALL